MSLARIKSSLLQVELRLCRVVVAKRVDESFRRDGAQRVPSLEVMRLRHRNAFVVDDPCLGEDFFALTTGCRRS